MIDYVICAAGEGRRLRSCAGGQAKPLIRFKGRTLLERALDSLEFHLGDRLIFVVQRKDRVRENLEAALTGKYFLAEIFWVELEEVTSGQLASAYSARGYLRPGYPVVLFNSDTYFRSRNLSALKGASEYDGIIPCYLVKEDGETHYSFCKTESNSPKLLEVAEKRRISDWATVGYYYFRDSARFLELAKESLTRDPAPLKEHYIAPLYNDLLRWDGGGKADIVIAPVDVFMPMGTPAELQRIWGVDPGLLKEENPRGTIVVDLDGTLTMDEPGVAYSDKKPNPEVLERVKRSAADGYQIVINTSRRMKTFSGNEAQIIAEVGKITIDWLNRHGVPYDGIRFGKPYAENGFYVDDRAIRRSEYVTHTDEELLRMIDG